MTRKIRCDSYCSPVLEFVHWCVDTLVELFLSIIFSEPCDLDIISQFDIWFDCSISWVATHFGLKNVLVWAELEPLRVPWEVRVSLVPVNVSIVGQEELIIWSFCKLKASGHIFQEESLIIPDPELVRIMLDILFKVALICWPFCEVWTCNIIVILTAKNKINTHILCDMK